MTHCQECGKPWGVILNLREQPSPNRETLARAELIEMLCEQWECDYEPAEMSAIDWQHSDFAVTATEVVYLTESLARFVEWNNICDPCWLDECWQELQHTDMPGWLLRDRKRRWAYRWDCCNIGGAQKYAYLEADE